MATNKRLIKSNDEGGGVVPLSFNTVTYTGNATARSITGVGFQPDFVWIKNRSATQFHNLIDSVRGNTKLLYSNATNAEATTTNHITSFDADGFSLGTATSANGNGNGIVAWCWKAGGAAVTNTDGTITSQVSANAEAGFSIVSFTGGNSSGTTVGHGLGKPLDVLIVKNRNDSTDNWVTWHKDVERNSTNTDTFTLKGGTILTLNTSSAAGNYNYDGQMGSIGGENLIAYCFAEVAGFSKFGVYNGTNAAGNKQTIGFEPSLIIFKITNQSNRWFILDNKRDGNPHKKFLDASSSDAEISNSAGVNFLLDGFDFQGTSLNNSGLTFTYMAFANQF